MNQEKYWKISKEFQKYIEEKIQDIINEFNGEFELKINGINVLENENNVIKSSTVIGYCIEEFIVSKLLNNNNNNKFKIKRSSKATENSYDFFSEFNFEDVNNLFLVNIKMQKQGSQNNAIAAINKLYYDYVEKELPNTQKHFMILVLNYDIDKDKIKISNFYSYFLEQINFDNKQNWSQDKRSWGKTTNLNSGRLQCSFKQRKNLKTDYNLISFEITKRQIKKIFNENYKKYLEDSEKTK